MENPPHTSGKSTTKRQVTSWFCPKVCTTKPNTSKYWSKIIELGEAWDGGLNQLVNLNPKL